MSNDSISYETAEEHRVESIAGGRTWDVTCTCGTVMASHTTARALENYAAHVLYRERLRTAAGSPLSASSSVAPGKFCPQCLRPDHGSSACEAVPSPSASLPAPEETDGWEVEALRTAIRWITDGHCDDGEVHHTFPYEERAWCVVGGKTHAVVDVDDRNAPQNSLIYSTTPEPAPEVEETAESLDPDIGAWANVLLAVEGLEEEVEARAADDDATYRILATTARMLRAAVNTCRSCGSPAPVHARDCAARPSPLREGTPASEAHRSAEQQANDLTRDLCDCFHEMPSASETGEVCDSLFADGPCGEPADAECHWYSDDHDHRPSARCHPFQARQDTPASPEEWVRGSEVRDHFGAEVHGVVYEHGLRSFAIPLAVEQVISRAAEERAEGHRAAYMVAREARDRAESALAEERARVQELEAALRPFAKTAREYDERVYPDDRDSQQVGVALGDLRAARRVLAGRQTEPPQGGQENDRG